MPMTLRVRAHLTDRQRDIACYLKPKVGEQITVLADQPTDESPAARTMAVRLMELVENTVIPAHVHKNKEKIYFFHGIGVLIVGIMDTNGVFKEYRLTDGGMLVIPAGCEHYVEYFPAVESTCRVIVVSSSQDGTDIEWEPSTEDLIRNEHRRVD